MINNVKHQYYGLLLTWFACQSDRFPCVGCTVGLIQRSLSYTAITKCSLLQDASKPCTDCSKASVVCDGFHVGIDSSDINIVFSFVLSGNAGDRGIRLNECTEILERLMERHEFLVNADDAMDKAIFDLHSHSLDARISDDEC